MNTWKNGIRNIGDINIDDILRKYVIGDNMKDRSEDNTYTEESQDVDDNYKQL